MTTEGVSRRHEVPSKDRCQGFVGVSEAVVEVSLGREKDFIGHCPPLLDGTLLCDRLLHLFLLSKLSPHFQIF